MVSITLISGFTIYLMFFETLLCLSLYLGRVPSLYGHNLNQIFFRRVQDSCDRKNLLVFARFNLVSVILI